MGQDDPIFVDANILMYAAGNDPALRTRSLDALRVAVERRTPLVTSVEVLQEILDRYFSLRRPETARKVYEMTVALCRRILPVEEAHTARALGILEGAPTVSPRAALQVAVMEAAGVRRILSADRDFDLLRAVHRVDPADFPDAGL